MKSVLVLLFLSVQILSAACPASTVQITGTLLNPDGSGFTGRLIPFLGYTIPSARENRVTFTATAGVLTASNNGGLLCLAPASYTVANYVGNSQLSYNTYWVVPAGGPYTIPQVETASLPTPSLGVTLSQLAQGGATTGQALVWSGSTWAPATIASGGGTWGTISGTIGNQTDLASALAAKQASLGYVPANVASNLSDLTNTVTARSNLGLGAAALLPGSTTVNGTVCTLGSTCTPSGVLPTGSGNKVIATPADGSSGVSALRSLAGGDLPAGIQLAAGDFHFGNEYLTIPTDGLSVAGSYLNQTSNGTEPKVAGMQHLLTVNNAGSNEAAGVYDTLELNGATDITSFYPARAHVADVEIYTTGAITNQVIASHNVAQNNASPSIGQLAASYNYVVSAAGTINNAYANWGGMEVDAGTVTNYYGNYVDVPGLFGGAITNAFAFWAGDFTGATNPYYSWFDSRGVRRVKEDATFNSVGQAIEALYNPQFAKYTPGATNYERVVLGQWNSNVAEIGTEASGTGVQRDLRLLGPTVRVPGALTVTGAITGALTGTASGNEVPLTFGAGLNRSTNTITVPALGITNAMLAGSISNANLANSSITVASTSPLTGGASTALGGTVTLACAACVTSSSPGTGIAHFAGSTQAVTSSAILDAEVPASLSGKTLVTPTIASFVNATHTHANAAGGGTVSYADLTSKPTIPTVTGGTCTSQAVTAISGSAVPTCTTITSAYIDSTVAATASPTLTTPKIAQINDANGNASIINTATASAVDQLTVTNSATGTHSVALSATGSDSAIDLALTPKGTGSVTTAAIVNSTNSILGKTASGGSASAVAVGIAAGRGLFSPGSSSTNIAANAVDILQVNSSLGMVAGSALGYGFSASAAPGTTAADTATCRDAAGVASIYNAAACGTTAANYRDLKLRHELFSGTAPTLTAGTGTIAGADGAGRVTLTAGAQTSITVTFGTAFTTAPVCVANDDTTSMLVQAQPTTTTVVLNAVAFGAADKIGFHCIGY